MKILAPEKIKMKLWTVFCCRWLMCSLVLCLLGQITPSMAQSTHSVLVKLNEVEITRKDLDMEIAMLKAEMDFRNRPLSKKQLDDLHEPLIENLINRELLYQRATQMKLKIRKRWVDRALADLGIQLGGRSALKTYIKDAGLSEALLKERIRKGLIVRRLLHRDVLRRIKVSEAEMQAFFRKHPEFFIRQERVRTRHILIATGKRDDIGKKGEALLRIQSIQNQIQAGANFAVMALEYSDDPSRERGGDLGYLEYAEMVRGYADAAFALKPGEVSDIVETRSGYHLIQMVDRIPSTQMAYRYARAKIQRTLRRNKEKSAIEGYLKKLKRNTEITPMLQKPEGSGDKAGAKLEMQESIDIF